MEKGESDQKIISFNVKKIGIILAIVIVAIITIAGCCVMTAKESDDNPFLTYPLHVDRFEIFQNSNDTYRFTVWVANQDYTSSNNGLVYCTVFFNDEEDEQYPDASFSFSSDVINVGPGERSMFVVWSVEFPINSTDHPYSYQTYRCQIVQ